jgi:large subunit ribosomal protein L23
MGFLDRFRKKTWPTQPLAKGGAKPVVKKDKTEDTTKVKPQEKEEKVGAMASAKVAPSVSRLLIRPKVSEKAARLAEVGTYIFEVPLDAEKVSISKAVEAIYKVKVTGVQIARHAGKPVYRGRIPGRRKAWKKAMVTLAKGQSLNLYEGV